MGAPGSTGAEEGKESKGVLWQPGLMTTTTTMGSTGGAGTDRLLRGGSSGIAAAEAKVSQAVSTNRWHI